MSNSADVILRQAPPAPAKNVTACYWVGYPGGRDKKHDSPTSTNNPVHYTPVREDGPEPEQAPSTSPPITTTSIPAATLPEKVGSLSSSTTSTAVPAPKMNVTATTSATTSITMPSQPTSSSMTKVTDNNSEGGSQEQGSNGGSKEPGNSTTIADALNIKTATSLLVTALENNKPKDGSEGQCSSTTEINEAVTALPSNNSPSGTATTTVDDLKTNGRTQATTSAAISTQTTALPSNNSPSSTATTVDDLKTNGRSQATTSAAISTQTTVTPTDKNPALENAVRSDDSMIKAQLPTANGNVKPTESRVSPKESKEKVKSSKTHTNSRSNPNLQSPNPQKMVDSTPNVTNSRPKEAANMSRKKEKLNTICCCIKW